MKLNVLVGEVMTKNVKKVDLNDTVEKAAKLMRDDSIGSVVVMSGKNVKGIVTTTDIVYKHVASKTGVHVSDIMSSELVTINPSATIEEAARLMVKHGIEKVLVFDKEALLGIITNNDIIQIEPAIIEILMERMKMGASRAPGEAAITECESCGNFSDSIEEVNGQFLCQECRGEAVF